MTMPIAAMLARAGLEEVRFSDGAPYGVWWATGRLLAEAGLLPSPLVGEGLGERPM